VELVLMQVQGDRLASGDKLEGAQKELKGKGDLIRFLNAGGDEPMTISICSLWKGERPPLPPKKRV